MSVRRAVKSGNPYHDPMNGRFTNKPGAGASGGGVLRRLAAAGDYRTGRGIRRDGNTVSKNRGSTNSVGVSRRGSVARNVSADEAMLMPPGAVIGSVRSARSAREGNRVSMSTSTKSTRSKGGPRGRIGKTAGDNEQDSVNAKRRESGLLGRWADDPTGRPEKGEKYTASEWARKSREATNKQRDDYEAEEKARSESQKLLKMAQQQTNMRARAAEFADRDMERRRERQAKRESIAAKKADIEATRGGKDPYRDAVNRRNMGERRSISDRERTAGGFYSEIVRNGQPIPRPSGDRLDSMVRDYELLNKTSALLAIRDLAESGDEGAAKYYKQAKAAAETAGVAISGRETMSTSAWLRQREQRMGSNKPVSVKSAESDLSKIAKASAGKIVFGHIS